MAEVKAGELTSEHRVAKSGSTWGIIAVVLGFIVTSGGVIAENLGHNSNVSLIVGAIVATAGIVQKTLTDLGYINSRTQVKINADNNAKSTAK